MINIELFLFVLNINKPPAIIQITLEFGSACFCGGWKIGGPGENPSELGNNQQQTQPTGDDKIANRTRVTEVRGERLSTTHAPMWQGYKYKNRKAKHFLCHIPPSNESRSIEVPEHDCYSNPSRKVFHRHWQQRPAVY